VSVDVKVLDRPKRTFWEQTYIPEIMKGMGVTFSHFVKALTRPKENVVTIAYPEVKREYPARFRGQHRLMLREDGQVRCVACMCCSTICPADCIHIVAAEHDDPAIEKYPKVFVIDHLRCIVCGLCVEACPCDAIRMDSGKHCEPFTERAASFLVRDRLMADGSQSAARQGGEWSP
jgi:NADH-quinone oxidoreductase subunit I